MATKKKKTFNSEASRVGRLFHDEWTTKYQTYQTVIWVCATFVKRLLLPELAILINIL